MPEPNEGFVLEKENAESATCCAVAGVAGCSCTIVRMSNTSRCVAIDLVFSLTWLSMLPGLRARHFTALLMLLRTAESGKTGSPAPSSRSAGTLTTNAAHGQDVRVHHRYAHVRVASSS
jgi:hypothetical protein